MNKIIYIQDVIFLHIRIKAKDKHIQNILQLLYETIAPTHKEDGCLEYRVFQQDKDILMVGKWKNRMSLDMHLLFGYHLNLFEDILPAISKKISIKTFQEIEPPITSLSLKNE